jgi:xylulokinase
MKDILAVDVGTTCFKMGVYTSELELLADHTVPYSVNLYGDGRADIEVDKWWRAFAQSCRQLQDCLQNVGAISLSVTTPGLVPMAEDGSALGPAILFFDQRSRDQAREIRTRVDESVFLTEACNLPVSGGSSLCSIMWLKENQPDLWQATCKFGHTNTYMVKRLTGEWAIDPSTTSITGMYNTRKNDLTWIQEVIDAAGIPKEKLPTLQHSHEIIGTILPEVAGELGLPEDCDVLCGANDAVLAGFSAGLREAGDIVDIAGTCEIISICLDRPVGSATYNIRSHVLPGRWVTLFVLNTGGKALEWFHSVFCADMSEKTFFEDFLPAVINDALSTESALPGYIPYLQGSRYSLDPLRASFSDVTTETTREMMLMALLKGNLNYLSGHLREVGRFARLKDRVVTTGGGARVKGMNALKKRWMGDFEYQYLDQSSLRGAAMLAGHTSGAGHER